MQPPFHNFWSHKLFNQLDEDLALASTVTNGNIDVSGMSSAYITHGVLLSVRTNQMPGKIMCGYLRTVIEAIENGDEYLPILIGVTLDYCDE